MDRERDTDVKRIVVGISGASGVIYGIRALQLLKQVTGVETHAIISPTAFETITMETDIPIDEVKALPDKLYGFRDVGAAVSSGSFHTAGMLVAPCSIKTLSGIANSFDEHLIVRAADVCLKERRPLVLMVRETPLHAGHISLMAAATRNGAIIMPPLPAFYTRPTTIDDIVDQTVGRALDLLQIETPVVRRWRCETDRGEA
jgi:flavin prenyltransferase